MSGAPAALITVDGSPITGEPLPELDQLADEIRSLVKQSEEAVRDSLRHRIEIGLRLVRAKELLPHGFVAWGGEQFGWTQMHLWNHMELARNQKRVFDLPADVSWREIKKALKDDGDGGEPAVEEAASQDGEEEDEAPTARESVYWETVDRLHEAARLAGAAARTMEERVGPADFSEAVLRSLGRRLTDVLAAAQSLATVVKDAQRRTGGHPSSRPRAITSGNPSAEERFRDFHKANPEVYERIREAALREAAESEGKLNVRRLIGEGSGVNNNLTPHYARLLMEREPALRGRFVTRGRAT